MTPRFKKLSEDLINELAKINNNQEGYALLRSDKEVPLKGEFAIYMMDKSKPEVRLNDPAFEGRYAECTPCEDNTNCMEIALWTTMSTDEDLVCMFSYPIAEVQPSTAQDVYNFLREGTTPSMYVLH